MQQALAERARARGGEPTSANTGVESQGAGTQRTSGDDAVQVQIDNSAGEPPPELSDAIAAASQAYDDLAANGQFIQFSVGAEPGSLQIEVADQDGNPVGRLDPSDVLRAASGEGLL